MSPTPHESSNANPGTPSFFRLLDMSHTNLLDAANWAKLKVAEAEKSTRRLERERLAIGYQIGIIFSGNDKAWQHLQAYAPTFREYALNRKNCLRYGLYMVAPSTSPAVLELTCTYANALQAAFYQGIAAVDIPKYIEDGNGINSLLRRFRASKRDQTDHTQRASPDLSHGPSNANTCGAHETINPQPPHSKPAKTLKSNDRGVTLSDFERVEIWVKKAMVKPLMSLGEEETRRLCVRRTVDGPRRFRLEADEG